MPCVTRCARAAISSLFIIIVAGLTLHAVNWDTAARKCPFAGSLVISSTSGSEMYKVYCAGCHGKDGRAKTRSARFCVVPPSDLTLLALRNRGVYPALRISRVLHEGTGKRVRGQGYMPVWEPLLTSMNAESPEVTELRIHNLTHFVKTLQAKSPARRARQPASR
jgi:mono/diheme cytochrome c family protein